MSIRDGRDSADWWSLSLTRATRQDFNISAGGGEPMCCSWPRRELPWLISIVVCFAVAETASAQTNSLFGNQGPASQVGSNLSGSAVGGRTTFGTTSGTSTGLTGQAVSGGLTSTGLGGNQLGGTNQAGTAAGFVGRNDSAGRFVGDQRVGQQSQQGNFGRGGPQSGNFGNRTGGGTGRAFGDAQFGRAGGENQRSRRVIRPRQEIAFTFPQRSNSAISDSLNTQFTRLSARDPRLQNVTVVIDAGGAATLRGEVDSLETSRLASIMARLEPGVRSVENELTVEGNATSGSGSE